MIILIFGIGCLSGCVIGYIVGVYSQIARNVKEIEKTVRSI